MPSYGPLQPITPDDVKLLRKQLDITLPPGVLAKMLDTDPRRVSAWRQGKGKIRPIERERLRWIVKEGKKLRGIMDQAKRGKKLSQAQREQKLVSFLKLFTKSTRKLTDDDKKTIVDLKVALGTDPHVPEQYVSKITTLPYA